MSGKREQIESSAGIYVSLTESKSSLRIIRKFSSSSLLEVEITQ